jgi:hypothetical protein
MGFRPCRCQSFARKATKELVVPLINPLMMIGKNNKLDYEGRGGVVMSSLEGQKAPGFNLAGSDGKRFTLSDDQRKTMARGTRKKKADEEGIPSAPQFCAGQLGSEISFSLVEKRSALSPCKR